MSEEMVRETSDDDFAHEVGAGGPVVVEFYATWCGNCRRLAPVLERVARSEVGRARFVKINADENAATVAGHGVSSTPTLILFADGTGVGEPLVGAHSEPVVRDWFDRTLERANTGADHDPGDGRGWVAVDACSLPTVEQPLRVAEFGELFTEALREVRRLSPTHLRLDLDPTAEAAARDLAARETDCCAFFSFTITTGPATTRLDIEVPVGRSEVLDGLAKQATATQAA